MIEITASFILMILVGLIAIPIAVFCVEIVASVLLPQREHSPFIHRDFRQRVAVIVPAHNESTDLLRHSKTSRHNSTRPTDCW